VKSFASVGDLFHYYIISDVPFATPEVQRKRKLLAHIDLPSFPKWTIFEMQLPLKWHAGIKITWIKGKPSLSFL